MNNLIPKIICFSHLSWDFVYQRPRHLMAAFAKTFNVYFVEEPAYDSMGDAYISFSRRQDNLWIGVPHLPAGLSKPDSNQIMDELIDKFLDKEDLSKFIFWYYTPMALPYTELYHPRLTVYDCMDELSLFKNVPQEFKLLERKLLQKADLLFTGGVSFYKAKKDLNTNIHVSMQY